MRPCRRFAGDKISQQLDRVGPDRAHDRHELHHVHPALATLVLGDEGLRPFEPARQFVLGQTGLFAGSCESAGGQIAVGIDSIALKSTEKAVGDGVTIGADSITYNKGLPPKFKEALFGADLHPLRDDGND
mgnify:FL=1